MSEKVLYEIKDGIGRITFNRPEARNAFTLDVRAAGGNLRGGVDGFRPSVLVLTGAGEKAFAAGTDISEFRSSRRRRTL